MLRSNSELFFYLVILGRFCDTISMAKYIFGILDKTFVTGCDTWKPQNHKKPVAGGVADPNIIKFGCDLLHL